MKEKYFILQLKL